MQFLARFRSNAPEIQIVSVRYMYRDEGIRLMALRDLERDGPHRLARWSITDVFNFPRVHAQRNSHFTSSLVRFASTKVAAWAGLASNGNDLSTTACGSDA